MTNIPSNVNSYIHIQLPNITALYELCALVKGQKECEGVGDYSTPTKCRWLEVLMPCSFYMLCTLLTSTHESTYHTLCLKLLLLNESSLKFARY